MSKKSTKKEEEPTGIESLIGNQVVEGYEVKEWSIRQFSLLYPCLKTVVDSLMSKGMTLDNAQGYLADNTISVVDAFVPVLPELLEVSLNISQDEVEKISATTGAVLGMSILMKNLEHIKSFLAQIKGSLGEQDHNLQTA